MRVKKKILLYSAITLFLTLIIVFFVFEFRIIKQLINENEANVTRIASGELNVYLHGLKYRTDHNARFLSLTRDDGTSLRDLAARDPDIIDIYLVDDRGRVQASFSGADVRRIKPVPDPLREITEADRVVGLALAAALGDGTGHVVIEYDITDFQNEFLLKFATEAFKVGVLDRKGRSLVWPFERFEGFDPDRDTLKVDGAGYQVHQSGLEDFPFTIVFVTPDTHLDTYRILTIMFLVFVLYFLIYQFIIEVLQLSSVDHYFDNIDFNIFNNLKEGIIIANKFGKVVFANRTVYETFAEKSIAFKETDLREIIGPVDGPHRMTLQKSGDLLEIIRSPIVKNGKLLGSMVVVSPSREKERLCEYALDGLVELLPDGVLFVDKESKVVAFNLMASYYLGHLAEDMPVRTVDTELADLIESNIGATAAVRAPLSFGDMECELRPVYDENRLYTGTIVFIKTG